MTNGRKFASSVARLSAQDANEKAGLRWFFKILGGAACRAHQVEVGFSRATSSATDGGNSDSETVCGEIPPPPF